MVKRVLEPETSDFSPEFFLFTPCTETRHVQKQSYILLIQSESLNQSCAIESLRMLFKTEGARLHLKLTELDSSGRDLFALCYILK